MVLIDVDPVPEDEAREWTDAFLLATGSGAHKLHLPLPPPSVGGRGTVSDGGPDGPVPLCGANSQLKEGRELRRRSVAAFPPGHRDICQACRMRLAKRLG